VLMKRIRTIHVTSHETYGVPRVHAELRAGGEKHGRKRIARLMRAAGIVGVSRRRGTITTTRRDKEARPAPDLVDRDFSASAPNQLWVADITFIPTAAGFLYLAVVLDALGMAIGQRQPTDVIHHSDQGSQYTSLAFGGRCRAAGVRPSMGSVGDAGACPRAGETGPVGQRHVREFLRDARVRALGATSVRLAGRAPDGRLPVHRRLYNPTRLHSALDYLSPIAYEEKMQAEP